MKIQVICLIWLLLISKLVFANTISNMVYPVSYFVNHVKHLELIYKNLEKYKKSSVVGISGIGKTQIARMYSWNQKDKYKLIWFIDGNLDISEELVKLAKHINHTFEGKKISEDLNIVKTSVKSYLTNKDDWLLIFDNLHPGQNAKIKEFIDWDNNGHILFVSQDTTNLPHVVYTNNFSKQDALKLTKKILDRKEIASFIVEQMPNAPVSIVLGAQLINTYPGMTVDKYKELLQNSNNKLQLNIKLAMSILTPSANDLLHKISLINNQSLSKQFLKIITGRNVEEEILELSKLSLLNCIDPNQENPIYEMHDLVMEEVQKQYAPNENRKALEQLIVQFDSHCTSSVTSSYICTANFHEHLRVIDRNAMKFLLNSFTLLQLKQRLLKFYISNLDIAQSRRIIEWVNANIDHNGFITSMKSNAEKFYFASMLSSIGGYYRRLSEFSLAIKYYKKALEEYGQVKAYESYKFDTMLCLAKSYLSIGSTTEAAELINKAPLVWKKSLMQSDDKGLLHFANARLYYSVGEYHKSLEEVNKSIDSILLTIANKDDPYLTGQYLLKIELLNLLNRKTESLKISEHLITLKSNTSRAKVAAQIYLQYAVAIEDNHRALARYQEAESLYISSLTQVEKSDIEHINDTILARIYNYGGTIYSATGEFKKAISNFRKAQSIYYNAYQERSKNIAQVSELYLNGAKTSCIMGDQIYFKSFAESLIEDFTYTHSNTTELVKFCNMQCPKMLQESFSLREKRISNPK